MVQLSLASTTGNQGVRYFPFKGHLGLTPIEVEGVVRTKLDADSKTLPASSVTISVRCYECRQGSLATLKSTVLVDYTQVLWSKPPAVQYADIGETELPFRFNIPAQVAGFSMANFVEYRVFWKIEAFLNHSHIPGIGVRQTKYSYLPLIRHDVPLFRPLSNAGVVERETIKSRIPPIRFSIKTPTHAVGPLDLVSVSISLSLPPTHAVSLRSASLVIERRLQLNDQMPNQSALGPMQPPSSPERESRNHSGRSPYQSSSADHCSEITLLNPDTRGTSPPNDSRPSVTSIASTESSGSFAKDVDGLWNKTLTVQWPAIKSNSRWAVGETIQSDMVSIRFFARLKIAVSSTLGHESIDLGDQEIIVASTNESERQIAASQYSERAHTSARTPRAKSKSPRRRRDHQSSALLDQNAEAGPSHHKVPRTGTSSRRPHTSAGPRDQSCNIRSELRYDCPEPLPSKPPASAPIVLNVQQQPRSNSSAAPTIAHQSVGLCQVVAWEEELARIERESRRSSVAVPWYSIKRKRATEPVA